MGTTKTKWNIDPTHSEIKFNVKHMMISTVSGQFTDFEGSVDSDSDKFTDAHFTFSAKID